MHVLRGPGPVSRAELVNVDGFEAAAAAYRRREAVTHQCAVPARGPVVGVVEPLRSHRRPVRRRDVHRDVLLGKSGRRLRQLISALISREPAVGWVLLEVQPSACRHQLQEAVPDGNAQW